MMVAQYADMATAPRDGSEVIVFNPITGEYLSKAMVVNGVEEWPMHNWDGWEGIWYPAPYGWRSVPEDIS